MSNLRRLQESQEQENEGEDEEQRMKHAQHHKRRETTTHQVVQAIEAINQHNQKTSGSRVGRALNLNRRRGNRCENLLKEYFIPNTLYLKDYLKRKFRI